MGLGPDRKKSGAVGLGTFEVRETSPSVATAFQNVGHLDGDAGTNIEPIAEVEEIIAETGNLVDVKTKSLVHRIGTNLLQTSIDEINLPKNALSKEYAFRYCGMHSENLYQYFCFPRGKFNPGVSLGFKNGKRVLPIRAWGLKQTDLTYDVPEYHMAEAKGLIRTDHLQLWVNPRNIYTPEAGTSKVFDISGFERHGSLNSDFATIWQAGTPESFLRFDGVNDNCNFGDVCDIDATSDILIEAWVRILVADGSLAIIAVKKTNGGAANAGWYLRRNITTNFLSFILGDASSFVEVVSAATILQNVWKHVAVVIDRNGNVTLYINGAASGTPISVATVVDSTNALNLRIAADSPAVTFGQADIGMLRFYNFGAGGLPSDIATIIARHYNAEKAYYGL